MPINRVIGIVLDSVGIGVRPTFAHLAATIADILSVTSTAYRLSFKQLILKN